MGVRARRGDRRDVLRRARAGAARTRPPDARTARCAPIDVVGRYGPGEYELLLPGLAGDDRARAGGGVRAAAGRRAARGRVGVASYPDDGRHAAALLARAGARRAAASDADGAAARRGRRAIACVEESMRRVQALAERAAAGDINVLILGETGVGKEVLARAIHAASARAPRPLVCINCAALSQSLLESELFGHERGAFTGAAQAKPGLLETAPGGTVFLDEVGELPPRCRPSCCACSRRARCCASAACAPRTIDVRFVAATNRDLEAEVARGGFRRDLYFRLNGMTLTIPPLRERPRDLPVLARAFVAGAGARRPPRAPRSRSRRWRCCARTAGRATCASCATSIERALLLCDGPALLPEHLPRPVPCAAEARDAAPASPPPARVRRPTSARASSRRSPRAAATRAAPRASSASRARC